MPAEKLPPTDQSRFPEPIPSPIAEFLAALASLVFVGIYPGPFLRFVGNVVALISAGILLVVLNTHPFHRISDSTAALHSHLALLSLVGGLLLSHVSRFTPPKDE